MRTHVVNGLVSENFKVLSTLVDGNVEEKFGSQNTTVKGQLEYNAIAANMNFAGLTNLAFGPTKLTWGPTSGSMASLKLNVPGGVQITTPSWKVVDPTRNETIAFLTETCGVSLRQYSVKASAQAIKLEASGIAIKTSGYKGITAALKNKKAGIEIESTGPKAETNAIRTFVGGFFSFS